VIDRQPNARRALGAAAELDLVHELVDGVLSSREARPYPNDQRTLVGGV